MGSLMWLKINGGCDVVILKATSLLVIGGGSQLGPELELPVLTSLCGLDSLLVVNVSRARK